MRILVLGGTVFLGRHVVDAALAAGHRVTRLTRGASQPELHPDVERVFADRDGGLGALSGRRWDGVIDTCGFVPRVVAQSAAIAADRYVFVSSVSVYADLTTAPDEDAATHAAPGHEDVGRAYGALKAASEAEVRRRSPRPIVVRPGLLGGPHDPTGRFTYWPVRIAEGGEVLAPAPADAAASVLDVRDLALWLVSLAETGVAGTFNATGVPTTLGHLLEGIRDAVNPAAGLRWLGRDALRGVEPWSELPLWAPDAPGMLAIRPERAIQAGLRHRPLEHTARDTLDWARTLAGEPPRQADGRYAVRTLAREEERRRLAGGWRP
jgi:2'-hydroxyisoflavone reductase